jgi:hypothetical protein
MHWYRVGTAARYQDSRWVQIDPIDDSFVIIPAVITP